MSLLFVSALYYPSRLYNNFCFDFIPSVSTLHYPSRLYTICFEFMPIWTTLYKPQWNRLDSPLILTKWPVTFYILSLFTNCRPPPHCTLYVNTTTQCYAYTTTCVIHLLSNFTTDATFWTPLIVLFNGHTVKNACQLNAVFWFTRVSQTSPTLTSHRPNAG